MDDLLASIGAKKAQFDRLRPMSDAALRGLQKYYDIELTYTSNAIEGNTLTHRETAEVIEHGITVGGKPLKDHLEALEPDRSVACTAPHPGPPHEGEGEGRSAGGAIARTWWGSVTPRSRFAPRWWRRRRGFPRRA